ncbi:hypothetical protein [Nocardioides houyundeii]|uniref:hypothetical protein n=1 Tax=Nocardioides houyundeii TaxID=2045452 RepID=UPI000DF44D8C|nr:hypothetical protein [Nocardioides houyundeii]
MNLVDWISLIGIALLVVLVVMLFAWADLGGLLLPVVGFLLAVSGLGVQLALPSRFLLIGTPNQIPMHLLANACTTLGAGITILTFSDAINAAEGQAIMGSSEVFALTAVLLMVFVLAAIAAFARQAASNTSLADGAKSEVDQ